MNIENGSFQLNHYTGNTPGISSSAESVNATTKPNIDAGGKITGNALITQVENGQMFDGKIVDINGGQVTIMMNGDALLRARMAESMSLNIGDSLSFLVKENSGANVLIQPFAQNAEVMKDSAIYNLLEQNNLSPSDKNYQIAEALLAQNMPADRTSMQKIMQQAYKYPDVSIPTLVTMNKMNLPINEASVKQFEQYQTNQHQIMNGISDLADKLTDTLHLYGNETTVEQSLTAFGDIMNIISDAEDVPNKKPDLLSGQPVSNEQLASTGQAASSEQLASTEQIASSKLSVQLAEKLQINESQAQSVVKQLMNAGLSESSVQMLLSNSKTPVQFMNHLQQTLLHAQQNSMLPSEKIQNLLQSGDMKELLSHVIKQKLTMQPEKMQDAGEVTEYYKQLYEKAGKILEHFSSNTSTTEQQLSQSAKGMQERIDFMQNLNQMFAYTQLPVRLDGRDQNADFFVYMNKKRLQEKREDVSALLHLDMDYLGPTDVHVSLRGTVVHTKFYVEDEKSAKLIDEHMTMLEQAIAENGFSLTNEVIMREPSLHADNEKNAVIREMFEDDMEKSIKRYSFDVRG